MIYPPDNSAWVKRLRFANLLDDGDNKLSPTKAYAWSGVFTATSTVLAALFAWVGNHAAMLQHVIDVAPLVAGHVTHGFAVHAQDKKERNLQAARMK